MSEYLTVCNNKNKMKMIRSIQLLFFILLFACEARSPEEATGTQEAADAAVADLLVPDYITDTTLVDTDDPAIWIHPSDPMQSLVLGTDKGDYNGGIYTFDLRGKRIPEKTIIGLKRPNNVDVAYGLMLEGEAVDIAVFTQRNGDDIRVLQVPEMTFIDGGGIPVFVGDTVQSPMGVAMYKRPTTGQLYAIVSRKSGADGSYLWQYLLQDSAGIVTAQLVRKFGAFKGGKEIEAIAVDQELGYVYYSDEGAGVRKYYADPDSSNTQLALFATTDFTDDHEGIAIYPTTEGKGYILVSDQQANRFHVFTREGSAKGAHDHERVAILPMSTNHSDGSDATATAIGDLYPKGFFVAMSDNRTFQIYNWEKVEAAIQQQMKE